MAEEDNENQSDSWSGVENIIPINIEEEMRGAYIDYSMSVIISRALPDVRDGLKPVHRRILYGMDELGVNYNKSYKKSARIVGDVLGKYHPHGDTAVYDSLVRMAQDWSLRYPMIDGQGNFGSMDGDSPAAMRYTEARLRRIAEEMLSDIKKNTVDFQFNYDDTQREPTVLPAKVPNLLINGASGIAVGMATNMAPHNLSEVVDGCIALIENKDITIPELMDHILAPDFPTGGTIYGYQGVRAAFETGRGRVVMRAKAHFDQTKSGREQIVVTEIPYQVNKASMIEKTAALINDKKIEGISDIRDESDRTGYRVVYDLRKDAIPNIVLNNLYKQTQLQTSFSINNVCLVGGRPKTLNLKEMLFYYIEHRHEVIIRRTEFELDEAKKRAHILEGYLIALDHIDEIIKLIRASKDPDAAKEGLISKFGLSDIQAKAILEMRLQRLTGMERDKIVKEYDEVMALIEKLEGILGNEDVRMQIIKDELIEVKERYGDDRRSVIEHSADEFTAEDMIPDEDMVLTITNEGYIKRTPLVEYRVQGRGGVGAKAAGSKDADFPEHLFVASAHNYLLLFTEFGKVFWMKVWGIPEGSKTSKGRAIQNLINIEPEDNVRAVINVTSLEDADYINNNYLVMCTRNGVIKKTTLEAYSRPRKNGINAITIKDGDKLLDVRLTSGNDHVVIASTGGRAIHFKESDVRAMGRNASGVRGIKMGPKEHVVGMVCMREEEPPQLLVVSENGYGKRSNLEDYRITKRGGKGVKTINITDKTGALVAIQDVEDGDELMIINRSGIAIRMAVESLRVMGRATQGVKLIRLNGEDQIAAVARISPVDEVEGAEDAANEDGNENNEENKNETNSEL